MKRSTILLAVVLSLCAVALGLVNAQPRGVTLYAGIQLPNRNTTVEYSAPAGRTTFTLERILNPEAVFGAIPNLSKPVLPSITKTRVVRRIVRVFQEEDYDNINFGRVPVGVYAVRAVNGRFTSSTMLIVSDLGLVVKRGATQALTYTANRFTGRTLAAKVWQLEGNQAAQGNANADGIARFIVTRAETPTFIARSGDAWAISGASWNSDAVPVVKGYVYTDRPVYRPGQRVEFKGVLRDAKTYRALSGVKVAVSVKDTNDQEVYKKTLTTDASGAFNDGVQLEIEPAIGNYRIAVSPETSGADSSYGSFYVEAYVKPEYQVTVTPSKPRSVQGDKVRVTVDATYLFGGKVSGGRVNYSVTRAPYYSYEYDGEVYDGSDDSRDYGSDLVIQEEARLNQQGQLEILLPLERDKEGRATSYRIEASVEDESRRTVAGSTRVIAFPSSINVTARTDSYIYRPRTPISVNLETRNLDDKGVPASVSLELVKQDWVYTKKNGYTQTEKTLAITSGRTGANGMTRLTLSAPKSGGYLLRAKVKDGAGRVSTDEQFAWVLEPGEDWYWNYRDLSLKFDKKSYKPGETATLLIGSPKPGTPVLVTIEGDGIRKAEVVRSKSAAISYRVPITQAMSPNVFVSATMLADENQYEQSTRLRVPDATTQLSVSIKPDKAKYAPGEAGKLEVSVTDSSGKGVPSELGLGVVDEAIYLVRPDETTDIHTFFHGARENDVGSSSSLSFSFESTIARLRSGLAEATAAAPRAPLTQAAFAQSKDKAKSAASDDRVRQDFKDTALWVPNLTTDENGRATVDVTYPDNLTTFRVTARGVDAKGRAGQGTGKTLVTKDVLARLILPPFLVKGDTATLSAVVNNTLNKPVNGNLEFELDGLQMLQGASRTPSGSASSPVGAVLRARSASSPLARTARERSCPVGACLGSRQVLSREQEGAVLRARTVLASTSKNTVYNALLQGFPLGITALGRARVDLPVRADTAGTASVMAKVTTDGGRDTIKLPLDVLPRGYKDMIGFASDVSSGPRTFNLPDDANLTNAKVKLYVTPSLVSAVAPALEYLLGYPYGCTEQTMSRFLPALLARQTLGANALSQNVVAQLPEWSAVGLKRLLDFQHEDGGWGFWTYDDSTLEMSAYVFAGLTKAKQLGLKVPNERLDNAVKYLIANAKDSDNTPGERASAYRSLADAGRADKAGMDAFSKRAELEPYAIANLVIAYSKVGDANRAKDLLDRLKAKRLETDRGIHWQKAKREYDWYWYWDDNEIQITAVALEAIVRMEPQSPLIPRISNWLLAQRRGPQWISTQDTASVIQAALALPKPAATDIAVSVTLNDGQAIEETVSSTAGTLTLDIPSGDLQAGINKLTVTSDTNITYSLDAQFTREPDELKADSSKGIKVTRKYEKLSAVWDAENKRYSYQRESLSKAGKLQPVTVGDLVLVTLTVNSKDPARYVMISDPLPAGLKALDERSLTIAGLQDATDGFEEWRFWYSGREFRDDRVDLYAYYLDRDTQVMRYVLRAQTPGIFTALPTHVFLMYDPDVTGLEKATVLTVRDRGQ
jgi:alpha-2-macroglobulin